MEILVIFLIFLLNPQNCIATIDSDSIPWNLVREFSINYKSIRSVSVALCGNPSKILANNRRMGMSLPLYNRNDNSNSNRNNNNSNSTSEQYHYHSKDILIKIVPIEEGAWEQSIRGTAKYGSIEGKNNRNKMYSTNKGATTETVAGPAEMDKDEMENKLVENLFESTRFHRRRQIIVLDMSCGNSSLSILEIVSLQLFLLFYIILY